MTVDYLSQIVTIFGIIVVTIGIVFCMVNILVHRIMAELKPGGGNSFRDQLNRIESKVESLNKKMESSLLRN